VPAITDDDIRALAAVRGDGTLVTSCYLDVDGSRYVRPADYERALDDLVRRVRDRPEVDDVVAADLDRVVRRVREGFDRSTTRGVAVFAAAPLDLFVVHELPVSVRNEVVVNPAPALGQLESVLQHSEKLAVLAADKQHARVYVYCLGELVERTERTDDLGRGYDRVGEADRGNVEDHRDELAHQHLRAALDLLWAVFQAEGFDHLVLAAPDGVAAELERGLHPYLAERLHGRIQLSPSAAEPEVRRAALEAERGIEAAREARLVEELRGAVMLRAIERSGLDAARLHLDLTALRVCGAYERSALIEKGWSADRRVARQIRALQATSSDGVPLYLRPGAGAAAELSMIGQGLERLRELLPAGLLVVADSALGNLKPLCEADRAGLRFICPLRAVTGFRERFLGEVGEDALRPLRYVSERERRLPAAQRTRYRGVLRPFEVADPETGARRRWRVAYVHSSEEEREIRAARERALQKAEDALARVERGLGGRHYPAKAHVDRRLARVLAPVEGLIEAEAGERGGRPTLSWRRNAEAIERAAQTDGLTALATNLPGRLSAERVLSTYKQQWMVERRHRDLKQTLRVRPIFLHNDDRIEALVSIVGLALLVFGLIEAELRRRLGDEELPGLLPEGRTGPPTGRNILAAFQGLGLTYTAQGIVLDRLTATQRRILDVLEIEPPWPEQRSLAA